MRIYKNFINFILILLICINIISFLWVLFSKIYQKNKASYYETNFSQIQRNKFIGKICPDIELITSENKVMKISEFRGKVILIKFSNFDEFDYPALIYLDHLNNRLKPFGLQTIYIAMQALTEYSKAFDPLILNGGFISNIFEAKAGDTILVDRDFNTAHISNNVPNYFLYRQICKLLFDDDSTKLSIEDNEQANLLKIFSFINIENGEVEKIEDFIKNRFSILMLAIYQCFGCQEHKKITLLKELGRLSKAKGRILLLFGNGNDVTITKAFAIKNNLFSYMKIGILQIPDETTRERYYDLFDFEIDPRIIIYNEQAKPIFIENNDNRSFINFKYIKDLFEL